MNYFVPKALAVAITVSNSIPGPNTNAGIGSFVSNLYTFALLLAGLLAFGAIVWGGIKYATGRGNPTAESEGRSWITNALLGLLLLAGAYIILYTINPNILNLQLPSLPPVNNTPSSGTNPAPTTPTN
jgi:hypothetical protein